MFPHDRPCSFSFISFVSIRNSSSCEFLLEGSFNFSCCVAFLVTKSLSMGMSINVIIQLIFSKRFGKGVSRHRITLFFTLSPLKMLLHCLLTSIVFDEKSDIILLLFSECTMYFLSGSLDIYFSFIMDWSSLITLWLGTVFFPVPCAHSSFVSLDGWGL